MFSYPGESKPLNFHVCKDVQALAVIAGWLTMANMSFETGCMDVGIPTTEFVHFGFKVSDWISDLKTRVSQIQIEDKRNKLATLESRLQSIMTPELRAKIELDAIAKELGQ